jgi:hypothetical protein
MVLFHALPANMSGLSQEQASLIQAQVMIFQRFTKVSNRCFREVVKTPGTRLSEKEMDGLDACVDQDLALSEYLVQKMQDREFVDSGK